MPAVSNPRELPQDQPANDNDSTGRFAIDPLRRDTMLPPPEQDVAVLTLEELGGIAMEAAQERPRSLPPPPPPVATASGLFSRGVKDALDSIEANPLRPVYLEASPVERAVLEIEDLTLRADDQHAFHNPYLGSSLIPPPRPAVSLRAIATTSGVVAIAAAVAAWFVLTPQAARPTPAPRPAPAVSARATERAVPRTPAPKPDETAAQVAEPVVAFAPSNLRPESTDVQATSPAPNAAPNAVELVRPAAVVAPVAAKAAEVAPAVAEPAGATPAQVPEPMAAVPAVEAQDAPASVAKEAAVATDPAVPVAALPTTPDRAAVVAAFAQLRGELAQCAADRHGTAEVRATIAGNGKVSYALVAGAFAGTPEGSCMARVIRQQGTFPAFSQPNLKLVYPLVF